MKNEQNREDNFEEYSFTEPRPTNRLDYFRLEMISHLKENQKYYQGVYRTDEFGGILCKNEEAAEYLVYFLKAIGYLHPIKYPSRTHEGWYGIVFNN